jgi:methylated-DNA-[protein]-cysteine S-methyltransferase
VYFDVFKATGGWIGLLASDKGVRRVTLLQPTEAAAKKALGTDADKTERAPARLSKAEKLLKSYFSGEKTDFTDKPDYSGCTEFERAVWETARKIPYGQTRSYGWIAKEMGNPKAARAVGQALGKNPVPIIVPCHRVIAGDGGLGGFSGGLEAKKKMLALEKASVKKT